MKLKHKIALTLLCGTVLMLSMISPLLGQGGDGKRKYEFHKGYSQATDTSKEADARYRIETTTDSQPDLHSREHRV